MINKNSSIAVFDSGMGGISVLKELVALMPNENYLFFGDSKHAPYGRKTKEEIQALCLKWADYFQKKECKAIVIACNTATSAAIEMLRQKITDIPIIGIEPALKPAVLYDYGKQGIKKIIVMATPFTINGERYLHKKEQYAKQAEVISIAAPKIVEFVEKGETDSKALLEYLDQLFENINPSEIDGIVLGCTHFPFVKKAIRSFFNEKVIFFDGAQGCARQTKRLLEEKNWLNDRNEKGRIIFENSDESGQHQALSEQLFNMKIEI